MALNPRARARGRKIEQQTFVVEHLRKAGRQCVGVLVR
jgi:hypothetical protein